MRGPKIENGGMDTAVGAVPNITLEITSQRRAIDRGHIFFQAKPGANAGAGGDSGRNDDISRRAAAVSGDIDAAAAAAEGAGGEGHKYEQETISPKKAPAESDGA